MNRKEHWLIPIVAKKPDGTNQRKDLFSSLIRCILFFLSLVYRVIVAVRNWAYDKQLLKIHDAAMPVISVGNLTTGGTGKTPVVMWLVDFLNRTLPQCDVAIISRGYHTPDGANLNDEGQEIALRFPDIKQFQDRDRVASAGEFLAQSNSNNPSQTIIVDDGFQHRRLYRDLDIVLIDATNPFGYGHLLPRGLLREPACNLKRADAVILTRSNHVSSEEKSKIKSAIDSANAHLCWVESVLVYNNWLSQSGKLIKLQHLNGTNVTAFCGIGNPDSFRKSLGETQVHFREFVQFPDHHHYSNQDLANIIETAARNQSDAIVCTCKDLVKIPNELKSPVPIYALVADIEITEGNAELTERIREICTSE
jgi:tetraacyldisaccharide 4'-kinase